MREPDHPVDPDVPETDVPETGVPETDALGRWRARTGGLLTAIAIGSLPILLLETRFDELPDHDQVLIVLVNLVVLVAFATDYLVGLILASDRRSFVRHEWLELLLVISQALVFVPSLTAFGILRAARALRVVRVVGAISRVLVVSGLASRDGRRILRGNAFAFAVALAAITWLSGAVAFTLAEDVGVDGRYSSFFDALWWSLATITTVGYGDIAPVTTAGRIVGAFTMIVGISVFAIVTARIASFLGADDDE